MEWWRRLRGGGPNWSGCSRRGGRKDNQDSWSVREVAPGRWAAVLADGLGGHADGRLAADLAVEAANAALIAGTDKPLEAAVLSAAQAAASAVANARQQRGSDMASTICILVADAAQAAWAHCGDSRIYRIEADGAAQRLTLDHSAAMATQPEAERMTADLRDQPGRNRLVAVLGMDDPLIDVGSEPLRPGTGYALCSDGYWESAPENALFKGLAAGGKVTKLVDAAVARQGRDGDNVTLTVIWPTGENR